MANAENPLLGRAREKVRLAKPSWTEGARETHERHEMNPGGRSKVIRLGWSGIRYILYKYKLRLRKSGQKEVDWSDRRYLVKAASLS
jgi:hypothetical protein